MNLKLARLDLWFINFQLLKVAQSKVGCILFISTYKSTATKNTVLLHLYTLLVILKNPIAYQVLKFGSTITSPTSNVATKIPLIS
jgi:hypothetical protein